MITLNQGNFRTDGAVKAIDVAPLNLPDGFTPSVERAQNYAVARDEDGPLVEMLLESVVQGVELYTHRLLVRRSVEVVARPGRIQLPYGPHPDVQLVEERSIVADGPAQWEEVAASKYEQTGLLLTVRAGDVVRVTYEAGDEPPMGMRVPLLQDVARAYDNRSGSGIAINEAAYDQWVIL